MVRIQFISNIINRSRQPHYPLYKIFTKNNPLLTTNKTFLKNITKSSTSLLLTTNTQFYVKTLKTYLLTSHLLFIQKYTNSYLLLYIYSSYLTIQKLNSSSTFSKTFLWSFKRNRFFPTLLNNLGHTYTTLSLGSFLHFFLKPRSFRKSKQLYTLLINFFRKIILYVGITKLSISVKFVPKYFSELLSMFLRRSSNPYLHPFTNLTTDEHSTKSTFTIINILFFNTKPYGFFRKRKKGVVKRKILRKVFKNNGIID